MPLLLSTWGEKAMFSGIVGADRARNEEAAATASVDPMEAARLLEELVDSHRLRQPARLP
ncbi:hypothetical protein [Allokutzneria oryzae]|uniref:Uncharacterized protein n=1 Tax=Allokutzneria oryzae TaxID=1378989 RepID=A0ABV6A0L5_9PSEU